MYGVLIVCMLVVKNNKNRIDQYLNKAGYT